MKNSNVFMNKCLELAKKGKGYVSPNPMVGCVIVLNNKIIGEGYHKSYGDSHAEVNAIESVRDKSLLKSSTLYVNLEPCAHFGKTPPCSEIIIKYKIPEVIIGSIDPFSEVSGKGIIKMQKAGIKVVIGILEEESKALNKRFFTFHEKKRPYIILKWAQSKDRFIAPLNQKQAYWMTSKDSKKLVHKWRTEEDAILIGRITAEKDNPLLTARIFKGKNPIRVIIDKNLTLSNKLNVFNTEAETIIFNTIESKETNNNTFKIIDFKNLKEQLLQELHKRNIQSIIIEGGKTTLEFFINRNTWDEARLFTANKVILSEGLKSPNIIGESISERNINDDTLKVIYNR